jgi:hypothetical protein
MPYALCPMLTEAYAHGGLCPRRPRPYARRVPHVTEKGYTYLLNNKKGNRRYIFPPISPFEKNRRPDCEPDN